MPPMVQTPIWVTHAEPPNCIHATRDQARAAFHLDTDTVDTWNAQCERIQARRATAQELSEI